MKRLIVSDLPAAVAPLLELAIAEDLGVLGDVTSTAIFSTQVSDPQHWNNADLNSGFDKLFNACSFISGSFFSLEWICLF